jgi:hypothetical protein
MMESFVYALAGLGLGLVILFLWKFSSHQSPKMDEGDKEIPKSETREKPIGERQEKVILANRKKSFRGTKMFNFTKIAKELKKKEGNHS